MSAEQSSPQAGEAPRASETEAATGASESTNPGRGKPGAAGRAQRPKAAKPRLKLELAHQVPGRVRMKIASAKGNPDLLKEIAETFNLIPGIERVTVNATTGSVVLHYNSDRHDEFHDRLRPHYQATPAQDYAPPRTEIDALARNIEAEADFLADHSHSAKLIVDLFKKYDQELRSATGNTVDLKVALAVGIIGVTVFELGASAATPVWLTFTVFTLNHIIEMNQPRQRIAAARAPVVFKTP